MKSILIFIFISFPVFVYSQDKAFYIGMGSQGVSKMVNNNLGILPFNGEAIRSDGTKIKYIKWVQPNNDFIYNCFLSKETDKVNLVVITPPNNKGFKEMWNYFNERLISDGPNQWIIKRDNDSLYVDLLPTKNPKLPYLFEIVPYSH